MKILSYILTNIIKISLLFVVFVVVSLGVVSAFEWQTHCEEKDFVLTAYYSPQSDQAFYYKEDFFKEVRLNGRGTHGASGEPVFNGMLAAPQIYDFGGEIYFPGLGVGKISDRGGAIVEAGERNFKSDRIDIWMGYGEAGLIRALDFGVQRKKGYYCSNSILKSLGERPKVGFDFSKIPVFKNFFDLALWKQNLWPDRRDIWVYTLQKYLVQLGYLSKNKQTGTFDSFTKIALCSYQTKKQISYPNHIHCGVFGPKTRYVMQKDVEKKGLFPKDLWKHSSVENIVELSRSWDISEKLIKEIEISKKNNSEYFVKAFYKDTYDIKVVKLQYLLDYLGFYNKNKFDGVFDQDVVDAVYVFQLDKNILHGLASESHLIGYVGPATRSALNKELRKKHDRQKLDQLKEILDLDNTYNKQKLSFEFYRPYKKGEFPNEEVRILQRFLLDLGLYNSEIDGKYDDITISSVYDFQLKYGLLTEASHYTLHGYMGPGTRDKINKMMLFKQNNH